MRKPTHILNKLSESSNSAWIRGDDPRAVFPDVRKIGAGFHRTAYRLGDYVIKSAHAHGRRGYTPIKRLERAGLRPPQQWYVNGWVVQPYYTLAPRQMIRKFINDNLDVYGPEWQCNNKALDLGYGNTGIDEKGRLVCFDW